MAKNKFYAVKCGHETGIFKTWAECEAQVKGYPNAQFKSFGLEELAQEYLDGTVPKNKPSETVEEPKGPYAFVDGSFNPNTNVYGYGGFLRANGNEYVLQGSGNDSEKAKIRNVAGEIDGAVAAVKCALDLGLEELSIYYDYQGIESWAVLDWKRNNEFTHEYAEYMQEAMQKINIIFIKVKGHTGVEGNERADVLAKAAVGVQ